MLFYFITFVETMLFISFLKKIYVMLSLPRFMFFAFLCPGESPRFDLLLPAREGDRDLTGQVPLAAGGAGEPGMQGAETIRLQRWPLRGSGAAGQGGGRPRTLFWLK